jgi:hypothetical protein
MPFQIVTVEVPKLETLPPGALSAILPVFAPVGTIAVIWVSELTVKLATFKPPKVTLIA